MRSESRCALRLRVQARIEASGHHFQQILQVYSDFPKADLQEVLANKIKRVQACIEIRGLISNTFYSYRCTATFRTRCVWDNSYIIPLE
jgi:hypothetical protein